MCIGFRRVAGVLITAASSAAVAGADVTFDYRVTTGDEPATVVCRVSPDAFSLESGDHVVLFRASEATTWLIDRARDVARIVTEETALGMIRRAEASSAAVDEALARLPAAERDAVRAQLPPIAPVPGDERSARPNGRDRTWRSLGATGYDILDGEVLEARVWTVDPDSAGVLGEDVAVFSHYRRFWAGHPPLAWGVDVMRDLRRDPPPGTPPGLIVRVETLDEDRSIGRTVELVGVDRSAIAPSAFRAPEEAEPITPSGPTG